MSYPPPPPPSAAPGNPGAKLRLHGRIPLRLALIFGVVGIILIVVGVVVVAKEALGTVDNFKRVSISSGGGTVNLDGTGKWVGYYEASDVTSSIAAIPNIRVAVSGPGGQNVALQTYGNRSDGQVRKLTYDYNGHKGAAAFQFEAKQKGTYRIQIQPEEQLPAGADFAFGRDIVNTGTVISGLLIVLGILLIIAAIVLLIVGLVKRSRHKKQLADNPYGGPPQNYPPPGYPQQPEYGRPGYGQPGYGGPPPPPPSAGEGPSLSKG